MIHVIFQPASFMFQANLFSFQAKKTILNRETGCKRNRESQALLMACMAPKETHLLEKVANTLGRLASKIIAP